MFEKRCYQKLDDLVLVWMGLEFHEIAVSCAGGIFVAIFATFFLSLGILGMLLGFASGAGLTLFFRTLRRDGPGHVFVRLYRWGLLEFLPTGMRPRHLPPLPGGGRRGRFRRSPVLGEEKDHAKRDALRYFGR